MRASKPFLVTRGSARAEKKKLQRIQREIYNHLILERCCALPKFRAILGKVKRLIPVLFFSARAVLCCGRALRRKLSGNLCGFDRKKKLEERTVSLKNSSPKEEKKPLPNQRLHEAESLSSRYTSTRSSRACDFVELERLEH